MAPNYTVVVGVSDTSWSPVALHWAIAQAQKFDGRVVAVRAWNPDGRDVMAGASLGEVEPATQQIDMEMRLASDVASVLGLSHDVRTRVVPGSRKSALISASKEADLLVIDAPRGVNLSGALFARKLVYKAHCPVVVMPPAISSGRATWLARLRESLGADVLPGPRIAD